MDPSESGQIGASAADVYEQFFVPALFREPAEKIVSSLSLSAGANVLDVACGTGVLARAALDKTGGGGRIVGVDCNAEMLRVAQKVSPELDWREGAAEALPLRRR